MIEILTGYAYSVAAFIAGLPTGTLLVTAGAVLGGLGAVWQLTRPSYGGPGRCSFCTRSMIGSVQRYRPGRPGKMFRYCARHVAVATRKAGSR